MNIHDIFLMIWAVASSLASVSAVGMSWCQGNRKLNELNTAELISSSEQTVKRAALKVKAILPAQHLSLTRLHFYFYTLNIGPLKLQCSVYPTIQKC